MTIAPLTILRWKWRYSLEAILMENLLEKSMPITLSLPYAQDPALQRPCYV